MNSTRNLLVLFLCLAAATASAVAWREHLELIGLRASADPAGRAALEKRLAEAQQRIKSAQDEVAAARTRAWRATDPTATADGETAAAGPADSGPRFRGRFQAALNDPKFMELMSVQQKAALDFKYAGLFKQLSQGLGLSPGQLDQFKNLLVQRQQALMDAFQAAREQGLNPRTDPAGFRQAVTEAQAAVDQQIQSSLGPAAYSQFQQYEQTLPQRTVTNQLQQSLSYSSNPLTDDQANQLVQILSQNTGQRQPGAIAAGLFPGVGLNQGARVTDQAIVQAQSVLSQPQVQALQQIQQQQQAQQKLQQMMRGPAANAAGTRG